MLNAPRREEDQNRTRTMALVVASIPVWKVRFDLALPAAPRIRAGVLNAKQPYPLHDCIKTVAGPAVVVPVALRRPVYRAEASDGTADSMNREIEMPTKSSCSVDWQSVEPPLTLGDSRSTLIM